MKYLVYIMSFMFVLTFVGYDNVKAMVSDAQEATTETVDEDKDADKEHKCVEGKCCKRKCDGDKTKDHKCVEGKCCKSKCTGDKTKDHKCGEGKCGGDKTKEHKSGEGKCGDGKAQKEKKE
ncbi:MAG: hypothetical protein V3S42_01815 [Candidatus Neomarinimicrobiota bacterium]